MDQPAKTELIERGGWLCDPDTGEAVEPVPPSKEFRVDSMEALDWALKKLNDIESEKARIEGVRAGVNDRLDRLIAEQEAYRSAFLRRFGTEIEDFARANLPKGKRSLVSTWGQVKFRLVNAAVKIADQAKALAWASEHSPASIKTTAEVQIGLVPDEVKIAFIDKPEDAALFGFVVSEPREAVDIKV